MDCPLASADGSWKQGPINAVGVAIVGFIVQKKSPPLAMGGLQKKALGCPIHLGV